MKTQTVYFVKTMKYDRNIITPVEAVEVNSRTLLVKRHGHLDRHFRVSTLGTYFDTWEEARQDLIKRNEDYLRSIKVDLRNAKRRLQYVKNLQKP